MAKKEEKKDLTQEERKRLDANYEKFVAVILGKRSPKNIIKGGEGYEDMIDNLIDMLTAREEIIVRFRYGLFNKGKIKTLQEVAKEVGLTQERVKQLIDNAFLRLRSPAQLCKLDDKFLTTEGIKFKQEILELKIQEPEKPKVLSRGDDLRLFSSDDLGDPFNDSFLNKHLNSEKPTEQ